MVAAVVVAAGGGRRRALRASVAAGAGAAVAGAVYFAHFAWVCGDVADAWSRLRTLTGVVARTSEPGVAVATQLAALWGASGCAWLAVGGTLGVAAGGGRVAAAGIAALLPGALYVALFRSHAAVHEFWSAPALPGAALLGASAFAGRRASTAFSCRVAAAVVVALAAIRGVAASSTAQQESLTTFHRDLGRAVEAALPPDGVLVVNSDWLVARYYVDRPVVFGVRDLDALSARVDGMIRYGVAPERITVVWEGACPDDVRVWLDARGVREDYGPLPVWRLRARG